MNAIDNIIEVFKALSDPNRLRILNLLMHAGELCVCDIERVLQAPQPRISRHLTYLRQTGMVRARREGQWMHYSLVQSAPLVQTMFNEMKQAFIEVPELRSDVERLIRERPACCVVPSLVPVTV